MTELRGKVDLLESKMDEMMLLLTACLKGKGLEPMPSSMIQNEEGGLGCNSPTEAIPVAATQAAREGITTENIQTPVINTQASIPGINPQQPRQRKSGCQQDLLGEDPFYTFRILSINANKDSSEN